MVVPVADPVPDFPYPTHQAKWRQPLQQVTQEQGKARGRGGPKNSRATFCMRYHTPRGNVRTRIFFFFIHSLLGSAARGIENHSDIILLFSGIHENHVVDGGLYVLCMHRCFLKSPENSNSACFACVPRDTLLFATCFLWSLFGWAAVR